MPLIDGTNEYKVKILELTRSFYPSIGGMERFVADRLKIYESLGFDYQVITTNHSEKKITTETLNDVIYLPSYTPYEIVPSIPNVMKNDYDVLSVNQLSYFYSYQAVNAAYGKGKKIILTPHLYFHTKKFKLIKDLHHKIIVPRTLDKVDKIICFTEYETEFWKSNFPEAGNKIVVIPHYFSFDIEKISDTRNNYGKFFLFLGRGERNKRIDLLLKAFDKLDIEYQLVLTTSEDEISNELKNIVAKNKKIHLLGRVPEKEKQNLLATCEALILPTEFEAFGIVNFEASYFNKPLILSNLNVFKEILNAEGVIYFDNSVAAIRKAIQKLVVLKEEEKKKMGEINFLNLKNYSLEIIKEKYFNLFNELVNQ